MRDALFALALWCASLIGAALVAAAIVVAPETSTFGAFFAALPPVFLHVLQFDFGRSQIQDMPALAVALPLLKLTGELVLVSFIVAVPVGAILGISVTARRTAPVAATALQLVGSLPVFCGALLAAMAAPGLVGAVPPPSGPFLIGALGAGTGFAALGLMAPLAIVIGLAGAGPMTAVTARALEVSLGESYVENLARLGLPRLETLRSYVGRQALAIMIKDIGNVLLALFAASAVAEWVFDWPGGGAGFVHAVALQDWPVAACIFFVVAMVRFTADLGGFLASRLLLGEAPPP